MKDKCFSFNNTGKWGRRGSRIREHSVRLEANVVMDCVRKVRDYEYGALIYDNARQWHQVMFSRMQYNGGSLNRVEIYERLRSGEWKLVKP